MVPTWWRADLFNLIRQTPQLDWLLLTKRIGNARDMMLVSGLLKPLDNVWLGSTVVTQPEVDRDVPKLLAVPARVHFLSCEPLIERVDLARYLGPHVRMTGSYAHVSKGVDWVIVGGESGSKARPMDPAWCDEIRQDCAHTGARFFFKQGSAANWEDFKNFESFPSKLRLRQFPNPTRGDRS